MTVLHPNARGAKFDMDYCLGKHMPLVRETPDPACKGMAVDQGLGDGSPGSAATYVAMGQILCGSVEASLGMTHHVRPDALKLLIPKYQPNGNVDGLRAGHGGHFPSACWLRVV